jgi:hypothetical protein
VLLLSVQVSDGMHSQVEAALYVSQMQDLVGRGDFDEGVLGIAASQQPGYSGLLGTMPLARVAQGQY